MEDIPSAESQSIGTSLDIKGMDPTSTEELTTPGRVFSTQNSTYFLPKFVKAVLCLAHDNSKVERSPSENSKVLTSERSLLSDDSINAVRLTKDALRVTGSE